MTDYAAIYQREAQRYHRMVTAEDCEGRLAAILRERLPLDSSLVADVGTGTGRVAAMLLSAGARIVGIEPAEPMLEVCRDYLADFPADRWQVRCADARALPLADDSVDAAVAGWAFGHLRHWEQQWQQEIGKAIDEMQRVTRTGGPLMILETLGTGRTEAGPPNDDLAEYYQWLEEERGFSRTTIVTDYQFDSPAEAEDTMGFFFGEKLVSLIRDNRWARVPEWTGVWTSAVNSSWP